MNRNKITTILQSLIIILSLIFNTVGEAKTDHVIIRTRHHIRKHHTAVNKAVHTKRHKRKLHHTTHNYSPRPISHRMSAVPSHMSIQQAISREHLDPHIYHLALKAYNRAKARHEVSRPYIALIDYSRPSSEKRFWLIDLQHHTVPYYTYVAHGKNSGDNRTHYFSNRNGSHETSLGVFATSDIYYGHKGMSLRLRGLEQGVNDKARARAVVVHGANYVSESFIHSHGRLGRSWGCPALNMSLAKPIIQRLRRGSMVFSYYPNHNWLSHSRYLLS